MRSHGWAGNAPATDEEAIDRILDAADDIIAEQGSSMRLTDVARTLGVTRQTVYRYFPGTEALMVASAMRSAHGFLDQLAEHISGLTEPAAALVEGVAFAVESLAGERQIDRLLGNGAPEGQTVSLTSDTARAFSRSMLHRLDVDWEMYGFDEAALDELAEMGLRTLHSILVDPGQPHRDGVALRRFIARWLGPAVIYPRLAQAMDALSYRAAPIRQPWRS
ncbi:TetR family transcriptional regulator [Mycobacterium sp. 852002-53434_SCH5985345]|uniref:TetR/AcrR family transcriptional regulator n=1 Tax=unclassified Mycobacterium TaxID=2642494 RepID=UPI0008012E30|nr:MULTISPECIES: TetR/AcrR family transcriptional regulator [unclassified Mycobacterium]OBF59447.1 TetR family transcriptional regulator [Mycobacterium sp. 852002-53434_SCH5985345]OBF77484.1 TetR family transcriptional regulator [Mycobacterium sp. 852002-51613_SCH5001154]OBF90337.1 TetR family transcriptional regulator [Mycobacterium sp. 852014-52450_SCH5900713]